MYTVYIYIMGKKVRQSLTIFVGLGLAWIISLFLYSFLNDYKTIPKHHSSHKTTTNVPTQVHYREPSKSKSILVNQFLHSLIKTTTNIPALVQYRGLSKNGSAIIKRLFLAATKKKVTPSTQSPHSFYKKEPCMNVICIYFLDKKDFSYFSYCWKKSKLSHEPRKSVCRFLNAPDRAPVALASFPDSGNTRVRGLL